jgi:hypothetical protein
MNCEMRIPVGEPDERGWRKWQCERCARQTNYTPDQPENIHFQCRAWPAWYEFGNWTELALSAVGMTAETWNQIRRMCGIPGKCKCKRRKEALNSLGAYVRRLLGPIR